jgi:hypothetical protein
MFENALQEGARGNDLRAIGVTWGYGDRLRMPITSSSGGRSWLHISALT